jgi:MGT family glycosyltransferase
LSKAVFLGVPLYAHMIQTLPLTEELVKRGEQVLYYSNKRFENEIKLTGADFREYLEEYYDDPSEMIWRVHRYMPKVREIIHDELDFLRDFKPDYIIYDRIALWAPFIVELLGLKSICTHSSIVLNKSVKTLHPRWKLLKMYSNRFYLLPQLFYSISAMRTMMNTTREFKFKGSIDPKSNADLVLVNTSKEFQPFVETMQDNIKFMGWIPSQKYRVEDKAFPWERITHKKLIYISLGTTFNRNNHFFQVCFEAFKDMDCQVVISTGGGKKLDIPDNVPGNFVLAEWVPQLEILQRVDVFVTQGGTTSVCESLNYGVPVVVVPQMAEQHLIGYWVEQIKVGKHLEGGKITLPKLKSTVEQVLMDPQYRQNAIKIGDSFRSSGGAKYGVDEIFKFKQSNGIS